MWLGEYMDEHGIEPEEIARRAAAYRQLNGERICAQPTGALVATLAAGGGKLFTHPRFANAIAAVCGATGRQRDMLVAKKHRQTWRMTDAAKARAAEAARRVEVHPWRAEPAVRFPHNIRAVVAVDRHANVLRRYRSVEAASVAEYRHHSYICRRCRRITGNNFGADDVTYRYADEWDSMTELEKLRDVGAAGPGEMERSAGK